MDEPAKGTRDQPPEEVQRLAPAAPAFVEGDTIPGLSSWVLERKLGGGGFGQVWLVRHAWNAKEKPRAVKFCTDPEARHRLVTHEKNVVLRVMKYAGDHPNVVPLLDCNLGGEIPWLMYEFVEGGTLAGLIEQWRELTLTKRLGKAVRTLHGLASALARFHRFDPPLVHRDMKPHNVLMADGKVPRITDFGIGGVALPAQTDGTTGSLTAYAAQLPSRLHAAGTRLYAPPEQLFGSTPDPRDDVYALGVIAYQIVMGDLHAVPGPDATLELRDLKVPGELAALIVQSVAINADRRPRNATEWEEKLGAVIERKQKQHETTDHVPVLKPAPPVPPTTARPPAHTATAPHPVPIPILVSRPVPLPAHPPPRVVEYQPPDSDPLPPFHTPPKPRKRGPSLVVRVLGASVALLVFAGCFILLARSTGKRSDPTTPSKAADEPKGNAPKIAPKVAPEPKAPAVGSRPGETRDIEIAPGVFMTFCWVPSGECQLGSPRAERDAVLKLHPTFRQWIDFEAEERRGKYRTPGFWMGKYEVTQAEWFAVMRDTQLATPSAFRAGGPAAGKLGGITDTSRFPVESVSWNDCQEFLVRANAHGGARKALGRPGELGLPHEDAWEYACRGGLGNQQPFYWGWEVNGAQANVNGTIPFGTTVPGPNLQRPAPVGSYEKTVPHPWGLCDTHGNVWEWSSTPYVNPGEYVVRGGDWYDDAGGRGARAARQGKWGGWHRYNGNGLRLVVLGAP